MRRRQDAIHRFRTFCLEQKLLTKKELLAIELDVRREMKLALKAAKGDAEILLSRTSGQAASCSRTCSGTYENK